MDFNTATSRVASFTAWVLVAYISAVLGMCLDDLMHARIPDPVGWGFLMALYWQPIVVGGAVATILTEFGVLGAPDS